MPKISFRFFRPRLSLRLLMLALLVFGGGLAWSIALARREDQTANAIEAIGGRVLYDWEYRNGRMTHAGRLPWRDWMFQHLGRDLFGKVTLVTISPFAQLPEDEQETNPGEFAIVDDLIARIGELRSLENLFLGGNEPFADRHLSRLSGLTRLRRLHIDGTGVTGPGLVALRSLTGLEDVNLCRLPIRDVDLASLSGLSNLKSLSLSGDLLTDDGLVHLGTLKNLETLLILRDEEVSAITSRGLGHLANLRHLMYLEIQGSMVESLEPLRPLTGLREIELTEGVLDDEGLDHLSAIESLESLILAGNPRITDAVQVHLAGLKRLRELDLTRTSITLEGLDSLAKKLNLQQILPARSADGFILDSGPEYRTRFLSK